MKAVREEIRSPLSREEIVALVEAVELAAQSLEDVGALLRILRCATEERDAISANDVRLTVSQTLSELETTDPVGTLERVAEHLRACLPAEGRHLQRT